MDGGVGLRAMSWYCILVSKVAEDGMILVGQGDGFYTCGLTFESDTFNEK
jgi:hypothetical protein